MLLIPSYRRPFVSTMKVPFDRDLYLEKLEGLRSTLKSRALPQVSPLFLVLSLPEVRRTPLPGSWVVRTLYGVCADTGMLTAHARIAVPLSPQRRSAAGLPSPLPTPAPRQGRGRTPTAMPKERSTPRRGLW